ncbi:DUF4368 domain-containing protein [Intestinimonas timonensis]|uniref:DUF4368 domain-containing protein n=1 Tax=Intestinimonas timonensis TaxID=1689270 RepID=UPI001F5EE5E9|nr:DUF4368 domain-containing protein [Intestinimonas timonensis]
MAGTKGYVLVLPDEVASRLSGEKIRLVMKLEDSGYPELKSELKQFLNSGEWQPDIQPGQELPERVTMGVTVKAWGVANSLTGFTTLSFCGLYLSIIFIILSCSVLAFEQLSAIDRNRKNYAVIDRLGVSGSRQASLIRKELSTVFLIPLFFPIVLTILLIMGTQFIFGEAILQEGLVLFYKDKTMIQKPETEWICHEDAHEAIVDREVWEAVQEKNRAVKQQVANHAAPLPALFTGKLVCADCGHPLAATRETQRRKNGTSKRYVSYICSHFSTTGHSACFWHRIYEISLKTLVLNEIRAHSQAVAQDENAVLDKMKQQILSESAAKQEDSKLEISRLRRRIGELEHMTAKLYEDKVSGIINNDTFAVLIQKSEQERIQKAERLEVLLAEERKAQQEVENIRQWAGIVRRYLDVQELDREIVEELIDHIEIGERSIIDGQRHQDIKIFYRFVGVV